MMGINELKKKVREHELKLNVDEAMRNANLPTRLNYLDDKCFKPQHCTAVEWRDAHHFDGDEWLIKTNKRFFK